MNKALRVLVLTDHRSHSDSNSLYALCSELRQQPSIAAVHVASRGNAANDGFFYHFASTRLSAWPIEGEMQFGQGAYRFFQETVLADLNDYDWIWLRLPFPIPAGFFSFLTEAAGGESRIFNRPSGIEETSNKAFITQFLELSPDTQLCYNLDDVLRLQAQFPIVLKPLRSYGGQGIVKVHQERVFENRKAFDLKNYEAKLAKGFEDGGYLGMRFLKNVRKGDKRVVVVNGHILGAVLRLPPRGSWLCNAAQGGRAMIAAPDEREQWMAERLSEVLLPKGIAMFGMDTLVNDDNQRVLSEVNTLSIGGIKPMADLSGQPLVQLAAHWLTEYMEVQGNLLGSPVVIASKTTLNDAVNLKYRCL